MKKSVIVYLFLFLAFTTVAQLKSPSAFLGYKLGDQFTPHYKVLEYFNYLTTASQNIQLKTYGKSYEGRQLLLAFIASEDNLKRLDSIQQNNLKLCGLLPGEGDLNQPAIVWLSYSAHGNESASTEAALQTLHYLLNTTSTDAQNWLKNTVIIMDPCINPDGRERYINYFNSVKNIVPDPLPYTREHIEPWPGGRSNHYYFDLNRDWAWQSQVETRQRMAVYNKWMPQVHVDFHEQGINEPYYFAPAAEPFHQDISKWQREFQATIGRNNAKYFDDKGWLYFTKERFDLLYPSYGDTYPTYNGAIGMTYEQGGSGKAGLAVINKEGDLLTLADRIAHHYTSALSTLETTSHNSKKIVHEFKKYFSESKLKPPGRFKTYVIKAGNQENINTLSSLLSLNGIKYGYTNTKKAKGLNYFSGKEEPFSITPNDLIINTSQPKSVLLKVLFEPTTFVSDSITYDITAWALPFAYGLQTYALKESVKAVSKPESNPYISELTTERPVAYASNWNSVADVKFLTALLKKNIRIRYSEVPFNLSGKPLSSGSLIITRTGNENLGSRFDEAITEIAQQQGVILQPIKSGFADKGPDLGSSKIRYMQKPRVALIGGEQTSAQAFGEIWHFFEQQINFPVSVIKSSDIDKIHLYDFNVLILPDGLYEDLPYGKLTTWVEEGGKLILIQNAITPFEHKKGFDITIKEPLKNKDNSEKLPEIIPYSKREREAVKTNIPGAIFKVNLDNTHPLAFGFPDFYYTLKLDDKIYNYLSNGWNVGVIKKEAYVSGFVGAQSKRKLTNGMLFGVQPSGRGSIVYLVENPLFRGFWENGKLLFSNAVFMVGE